MSIEHLSNEFDRQELQAECVKAGVVIYDWHKWVSESDCFAKDTSMLNGNPLFVAWYDAYVPPTKRRLSCRMVPWVTDGSGRGVATFTLRKLLDNKEIKLE